MDNNEEKKKTTHGTKYGIIMINVEDVQIERVVSGLTNLPLFFLFHILMQSKMGGKSKIQGRLRAPGKRTK